MGFWFYMLFMAILVPLIMILVGRAFMKTAPKSINYVFGYRTARSMKNADTWAFAHQHCGKLWWRMGLILLPLSVIPLLFVVSKEQELIGNVGLIVTLVDTAALLLSIFPTERALRKTFDEEGNRK
jgi:uncharacterized membrane protein